MSDIDQVMNNIKEEIEKENPSGKKILTYIIDLYKNEKFQSLNDLVFYDIIGEIFKLNLKFFMDSLYKELKKKLKKLYGEEKEKLMEKHLIEKFGLYSREQAINRIKQEFEKAESSKQVNWRLFLKTNILAYLDNILSNEEYKHLSDSDFYFIIGETFKSYPAFFMDLLHPDLLHRLKAKNRLELLEFIIEKYCLEDGEHILYKFEGNIKQTEFLPERSPISITVDRASILLTNYRFIVQGLLEARGGQSFNAWIWWGTTGWILSGSSERTKIRKDLIESSPSYGFQFTIKNNRKLRKTYNGIRYFLERNNRTFKISVKIPKSPERGEKIDKLFEILSKDAEPILQIIKKIIDSEEKLKIKQRNILNILYDLKIENEFPNFTDSEYVDFIAEIYKLNPSFFMDSLYPRILDKSSHFLLPSFQQIKSDLIEIIEKLNKQQSS